MKIGIDIRCLMHQNHSGVAEYTKNLLKHLFKIDSQNQYVLFYNSRKDISTNLPKFEYPNVKLLGYKYPNKFFNASTKLLNFPKIDKLISDVDIFFIPNFNFIALSKECKNVVTVHDLSFIKFPEFFSVKQRLWHKIINPKKIVTQADKIIADSNSTKNDLIDLFKTPSNKIQTIHLGVDHEKYKKIDQNNPRISEAKKTYKLPKNFILFLGTIEPRKNIESIIESFDLLKSDQKHQDLHLVIAGHQGWKNDQVFKLAQKSKYTNQITYIGYIKPKDKPALYNLAKIFIFPSYYEGFGLPILEAQACGTPVITSTNSSLIEVVKNSGFLIKPDNVSEISQAIQKILNSKKLREELISKGTKNSQRFSWEKCAKQTLEYFNT